MTPQERELVADLFDRLAALEDKPRDPDAARAIEEGLRQAPNAVYALVQSVLVQDEALRRADARIRELEAASNGGADVGREPRGFLDNMRDVLMGEREGGRGSVPSVRTPGRPMGAPSGFGLGQSVPGQPTSNAPQDQVGRGGSFLGTAAAAAAGVIGGSLLLDSIRSMMGGGREGAFGGERIADDQRSPWGNEGSNDLARSAGLEDIGSGRGDQDQLQNAGLFDSSDDSDDADYEDDDGFFDGGSEEA
jgi:hypothetical protein